MTTGNPKIVIRITPELGEQIADAIARRNRRTREEPWDISGFVRVAIRDKLAHMNRSRRTRPAGRSGRTSTANAEG